MFIGSKIWDVVIGVNLTSSLAATEEARRLIDLQRSAKHQCMQRQTNKKDETGPVPLALLWNWSKKVWPSAGQVPQS
ncbi:hypothetical protein M514_00455 [Trichuris suis]|uniref:Uncharacterized protein n=1 Tax=Trichuris suis TaxID=68888 RepID=A0A085MNG6_9BILA|nr:hypothetical protein M513_00455 [Trichuris suis]KFD72041.1 hypothetical protein M514_00455 [Trichuris suis]